ncbi:GGDEF domain-containing protein [Cellulomonas fimi]|uniref:GGDEF domain-containing protein n=1 Tax=Cellulomonas fimi TaxID=1708 RepID=A0A7Y0LVH0_CELFI|nr:GGDEF domain-containing protein [Cellulomonas fimi]NMR18972.1 GGDEF domain-containing protein [Cellulomonas fimi]
MGSPAARAQARRAHVVFGVAVGAHVVAFLLTSGAWRDALALSASFVALVVVTAALVTLRRTPTVAWLAIVLGLAGLVVYHGLWQVEVHVLGLEPGTFVVTTVAHLLGYVLLLTGGLLLLRSWAAHDAGAVLEAGVFGLAVSLLVWVAVVAPALDPSMTAQGRVQTMVVLVMIGGIGGAIVQGLVLAPHRRGAIGYLLLAFVAVLAGTLVKDLTTSATAPLGARWVLLNWIVAYTTLSACALHPSVSAPAPPGLRPARLSTWRLVALGLALVVGPTVFLVQNRHETVTPPLFVAAVTLCTVLLVVARLGMLARLHDEAHRRLEVLADQDGLTGLPNRRALTRHLEGLLARVASGAAPGAVVVFLDLDGFKAVNDRFGHAVGDDLLRAVARRLSTVVSPDAVVVDGAASRAPSSGPMASRLAGDEFVVVVEADPGLTDDVVARVAAALADDVVLGERGVPVHASMGTAGVRAGRRVSAQELLDEADTSMYAHKRSSRGVRVYERKRLQSA